MPTIELSTTGMSTNFISETTIMTFSLATNSSGSYKTSTLLKTQSTSSSCQAPIIDLTGFSSNITQQTIKRHNDLIYISASITINCMSLSNVKQWTIFKIENLNEKKIQIQNNPTLNYAELVLQPKTLSYGLYRFVFTVTMLNIDVSKSIDTFIQIIPSGLVLSTLKLSQPMFGGRIEIYRGLNQPILFSPFLFTYDIDAIAVITSLTFKYTCQLIDSNIPSGYPQLPGTNQTVYLDGIKQNSSHKYLDLCFNASSKKINTLLIASNRRARAL
jgi:hypothetical protein